MASPKTFAIRESEKEIKSLMKKSSPMLVKRLHALLIFKQHENTGISKREVAEKTGVNHNSIQSWRTAYIKGGMKYLLAHKMIGYKRSVITGEQKKALEEQLNKPNNGIVGFVELLAWFNQKFGTDVNYYTFHGYVVRTFKAKIKTARKSHIKKDMAQTEAFKKTLLPSAGKSYKRKKNSTPA